MDWKDIEVGDYISVRTNNTYTPQVLSGEVTHIRHFNSRMDYILDPINYHLYDNHYNIRITTQEPHNDYCFKEYIINSTFCTLTNIIKKGGITTMPLEIGKKYKVNIPQDWRQTPEVQEFTGKLVKINLHNSLTHLVYSEELDNQEKGHSGYKPTGFGHWYCKPEWLTPLEPEPTKEHIKLEDIFNE